MRGVAVVCFFLSGASGLIFQVIWTRLFSLVFGGTTLAISTVLTAFMGGLALGSFLAGRLADRVRDPLRAYAVAEAGIGICALLLPLVVGRFDGLNRFLYAHFQDHYALLAAGRFAASALVIVVPTTLMGATLPLLSRYFVQTDTEHARVGMRVGTLYALNTAGAVVGTFLGGFVLLPHLGLSLTNRLAAGTNLALGLVVALAYLVRRRLPARAPRDPEVAAILAEVEAVPTVHAVVSDRARRLALWAFAFSGAAAMVYQVIWSRALNMAIGSSVYAFTLVLTAFLVGLSGGTALIGRLTARSPNPVGLLALTHLAVVAFVGVSYLLIDKLGWVYILFMRGEKLGAGSILTSQFLVALLTMLPATFAMGGVLPLTIRIYVSGLHRVGQDVGSAYSVNTIGAIVGSFLAGFVVIPTLQMQAGIYAAAMTSLAVSVVLALAAPWGRRAKGAVTAAAAVLAGLTPLLPRWNLTQVSAGVFRPTIAEDVLRGEQWDRPKLIFYRDGISTTVTVEQWSKTHFSLKNNGKVDASTGDDMPTQITVGLLPMLLHPRAGDYRPKALLIGFASGVSAGAMLQYPMERLDVVELEPAILTASVFFNHVNNRPLAHPRIRVVADDGRNFLAAGSEPYDVIVNEPSNPWITGVSNLFTREYFEIGRRRLKPDGIFCTWVQVYELSPRNIKAIYRSFASVFPYAYAFSASTLSSDTYLVGSMQPLRLDIRRLKKAYAIPSVKKELTRGQVERPDDLIALTLLAPNELSAYAAGARINTDDNALIEFGAPRDLYNHGKYDYYVSKLYGEAWPYGRLRGFVEGYGSSEEYAGLVHSLLVQGKMREARAFATNLRPTAGEESRLVTRFLELLDERESDDPEVDLTEGTGGALAPPKGPPKSLPPKEAEKVAREYLLAERRAKARTFRAALDVLEAWPEEVRESGGDDFQLFWGYLAYKTGEFRAAAQILEPLWSNGKFIERRPALLYYLGRAYYGNADYRKGIKALRQWYEYRRRTGRPEVPPPYVAPRDG
ncbi:MAG: fused MFS/spermidine synthase [Deltaproteobacteria bacterium]|nr:fused MFS/spermidine synthase [Deltaproteobacteria bacterium]